MVVDLRMGGDLMQAVKTAWLICNAKQYGSRCEMKIQCAGTRWRAADEGTRARGQLGWKYAGAGSGTLIRLIRAADPRANSQTLLL